jgi:hypothetical protein
MSGTLAAVTSLGNEVVLYAKMDKNFGSLVTQD